MQHKLNFSIYEDSSTDSIIFVDKSSYYEYPTNPLLEVKFPNLLNETYQQIILPEQLNVLTRTKLCYGTGDFQDGVYVFRYSVAPNARLFKEVYHLRTTKLTAKIKELVNIDMEEDSVNKIYKADLMIQAGKLEAEKQNINKAAEYYNLADKLIKKLECDGSM
jgi:hypothetical protein